MGRKEKSNAKIKTNHATRNKKKNVLVKEGRVKRYQDRIKQQRQTEHSKTMKETSTMSRERMHEDIPQTLWQGNKTISEQNMGTKRLNRKAECTNNMVK